MGVVGGIFLLTPVGEEFRVSTLSVINPASVERQTLADLREHLETVTETVAKPAFQSLNSSDKTKELKAMLGQAGSILNKAEESAEKSDLGATISAITKTILPKSWTTPICPKP